MDRGMREETKQEYLKVIDNGFAGLDGKEKNAALRLVQNLFPRTETLYRNMSYGYSWEETWAKEKRIADKKEMLLKL